MFKMSNLIYIRNNCVNYIVSEENYDENKWFLKHILKLMKHNFKNFRNNLGKI